uniref:THAP10 protein n=1 Tax=Fopius arisanus TaxID=64838 RepID=A0A0C9R8Q8_9HYME
MPKICVVSNCGTGTKGVEEKRSLFRVPSNKELRLKWEAAIPGIKILKLGQSVCERHFPAKYINKKWIKYDSRGRVIAQYDFPRPRLDPRAIPCIFTDEVYSCSDPWFLYNQQKEGGSTAGFLVANKISAEGHVAKQETMQEVYSTGEHSYCRLADDLDASGEDENGKVAVKTEEPSSTSKPPDKNVLMPLKITIEKAPIDPEDKFMEVEQLLEAMMNGPEEVKAVSERHAMERPHRITLTTPTGQTKQLTLKTFGRTPQIHFINSEKDPPKTTTLATLDVVKTEMTATLVQTPNILEEMKLPQVVSDTGEQSPNIVEEKHVPHLMDTGETSSDIVEEKKNPQLICDTEGKNSNTMEEKINPQMKFDTDGKSLNLVEEKHLPQLSFDAGEKYLNRMEEKKLPQLRFDTGGIFENGKKLVKLPYMWSISELVPNEGRKVVFSHVIVTPVNNVDTPVLNKSVIIHDTTGIIDYYAHGKRVDVSNTKLPRKIEEIVSLQVALYTFQKMRVCGGITPINKSREALNKDIYQDQLQCWRHNDCKILVDRGKCELCSKLQKTIAQKRRRAEKNPSSLRVSSAWDPKDQVAVLKKKFELERRKRIHAQAQVKKLTEASKENGVKVKVVKKIKL